MLPPLGLSPGKIFLRWIQNQFPRKSFCFIELQSEGGCIITDQLKIFYNRVHHRPRTMTDVGEQTIPAPQSLPERSISHALRRPAQERTNRPAVAPREIHNQIVSFPSQFPHQSPFLPEPFPRQLFSPDPRP